MALAAGVAGWAMAERIVTTLPGVLMDWRSPIGPNRPVIWQPGPAEPAPGPRLPNIVLIVADDLGFNDLSLHGGGLVPTPNIDGLATEGAQFLQAYSGSATCAPSRAALMTGRYPARIGFEFTPTPPVMLPIVRFLESRREDGGAPWVFHPTAAGMPDYFAMEMPGVEITLPEALAASGHHRIHIGKWHLGNGLQTDPIGQGFDESLELAGLLHAAPGTPGIVDASQAFDPMDRVFFGSGRAAVTHQRSARFQPVGHLTDYFTDQAVAAIEANANRPFFLHLAYWAPHAPLQALQSDYDALDHIPGHAARVYAAMVRALDRGVGQVLDALDAAGIADNTLVIFTSDNGGTHTIGLPQINAPFRGWKATFFDGGLRVPLLMRWPGTIPAGQRIAGAVHHTDLLPTLAHVAGVPLADGPALDGQDLWPSLQTAAPVPPRSVFYRSGGYEAVIDSGWKLQRLHNPARLMLFDLTTDPFETTDLAQERPDQRARLLTLLESEAGSWVTPLWPSSVEMPVPLDHPLGVPWPPGGAVVYWPN